MKFIITREEKKRNKNDIFIMKEFYEKNNKVKGI